MATIQLREELFREMNPMLESDVMLRQMLSYVRTLFAKQHKTKTAETNVSYFTLTGSTRQTALLTTTGDYDRYYETLTDMPNRGFYDLQPVRGKSRLGSDWDVRLYGEVGAVWHTPLMVSTSVGRGKYRGARSSKRELKWRAGVFVGYGIRDLTGSSVYRYSGNSGSENSSSGNSSSNGNWNSSSNAGVPMTEVDPTRYMAVTLHSVYSSREAVDTRLNQLSFGIRLTPFFSPYPQAVTPSAPATASICRLFGPFAVKKAA